MRGITAIIISLVLFSGNALSYEYVIFKRVTEDLKIEALPYEFTVWHIDALNMVKLNIEGAAATVVAEERIEFMQAALDEIPLKTIEGLLLMGWAGTEKMKSYGLTTTPAAVLLDDDGNVVETWDGIVDANILYRSENRP